VRVGEHVTRYVRRGSGPSVVVVGADVEANPLWTPLVEQLTAAHRVVVPQAPPTGTDVSAWLRGFIEGIGLSSIVLIAGSTASSAALDLATTDDFTVRRLILLPSGESNGVGTTDRSMGPAADRTLWVLPDWSHTESLSRIARFVA
jgi:hypothetical protein